MGKLMQEKIKTTYPTIDRIILFLSPFASPWNLTSPIRSVQLFWEEINSMLNIKRYMTDIIKAGVANPKIVLIYGT